MAKSKKTKAQQIRNLFTRANQAQRSQWQKINQKGFDFSNDNQLTQAEKAALENQGMPTFTINRIMPVVEMLNFYATANTPRWQAIGVEGSDTDVAAVFSDMADYIWNLSDGSALYSNCINDAITKSIGYMQVDIDKNKDNGMGEVVLKQPEPFDIYVDPKSRDMLFRDASFIMIRKILPKSHLLKIYPDQKRQINKAGDYTGTEFNYSERAIDDEQKDFIYQDVVDAMTTEGEDDPMMEFFEVWEKVKIPYVNVFYRVPLPPEQMRQVQAQVQQKIAQAKAEMEVELQEQILQMQRAVESGEMLKERYELEVNKAREMMGAQLNAKAKELQGQMQAAAERIENTVVTEKEFKIMIKQEEFAKMVTDQMRFFGDRIKQTCVVGDTMIKEYILPQHVTEYPIVPFHFKWTGTPFPVSAVSPLIGKQQELNKSHQLMVHNASLGSSLRWMYEEGSINTSYWEDYSSAPGALLPKKPGFEPPTPIQPMPLSNSFFNIVQEGKQDMEYLAGIYGAMQGDTNTQHETYRGMLAMDEYGTRRVKQWLKHSTEPGLKQLGEIVKQYSQALYTAHKVFRIVQPSSIQESREVAINVPMYNDLGEAIGKFKDYSAARFDIRIVAGSTMPVNRWAYLDELKQLLQAGVVDDIAVLAETDIKNKDKIAQRKSLYAQLQSQMSSMEESIKDRDGTIETLERQLVQAGIKQKIMQAEMEVTQKKADSKNAIEKDRLESQAQQKHLRNVMKNDTQTKQTQLSYALKDIERKNEAKKANNVKK
tara:strand:+ start:2612 stop:4915 length:2304 start_codon:yes stop_codon:yes gene_type:complete